MYLGGEKGSESTLDKSPPVDFPQERGFETSLLFDQNVGGRDKENWEPRLL